MNYADTNAGRVRAEGSEYGRTADGAVFWTHEGVRERLIETVHCWWRMPGGGSWPFASDGPWHLIRKEWMDWDARDPKALRSLPLRRSEVAAMNEATEWIAWVPEDKRRVLVLALIKLASGHNQVPYRAISRRLEISAGSVEWRFDQALRFVANVLNALSGVKYVSRKGAAAAYPKDVREVVERLKGAENCAGNVSRPVI